MLEELMNELNKNGGVKRFFQRTEVEAFRQWYEKFCVRYGKNLMEVYREVVIDFPEETEIHTENADDFLSGE